MATEKMTKKEMFTEIIELADAAGRDDIVEFANEQIALIDNKAEKAKIARDKKKAEGDEIVEKIAETLTAEGMTPDEIADTIGGEVTKAKVVARMKGLIESGVALKDKNDDGKVIYKRA